MVYAFDVFVKGRLGVKTGTENDKPGLLAMLLSYCASSASLLVANLSQLVTFAILARSFGADEFGRYVSFIAITSIAVHLCGLGASESLVRRVPQDRSSFAGLFGHNLVLTGASGIVLVGLGIAALPLFLSFSDAASVNIRVILTLLVTNVVLVRLIMMAESIFIAHGRFAAANASVVGFALVRTLAAACACLLFKVDTVAGWASWQLVAHGAILTLYAVIVLRIGRPRFLIDRQELRLGLFFATPFLFRAVRQNVDLLVLGLVAGAEVVGSYGVARRITDSSYMAIDALNRLAYPRLAVASRQGIHHAYRLTVRLLGLATGLGLAAGLVIFVLAGWMPLVFGPEYVSLPTFLAIMAWLIVPIAIWSIAVDLLGAAGRHGARARVLNLSNGVGALVIGGAAWAWPPYGVFVASYLIEISIVIAAWLAVRAHVARSIARERETGE